MVQSLSYLAANTKLGTGDDSVSLVASGNSFVISDGSQSSTIAAGTDLGSGGATVYANSQAFPLTGLSAGDFAFASNNNTLYMTNGSGWYKIALVNQDPSISLSATSVTTEPGSNTANVTYTITEPEGTPTTITISYDFTANANIVHDSSNTSLSITNTDSNTYTGTVTVTVSDGVNTGVGTISLTNSVVIIIDNSNYTSLLVKASGNGGTNTSITDSSTNAHTVSVYGNTQATSFSPYRASGYSAYIDGSGSDWLKTDTHADFTFGTGDFTVECWYYPISKAQSYARILHFGPYWQNNQAWGILDRHDSYSTKITVQAYTGAVLESSTTVTDGEWYHIALERSGTTITLYINGIAEDTYNISTNNFPDASSTSYLNIGNVSNGPNLSEAEANGYVKDVRIVKGSAVYQGNFTPPTSSLTAVTNTVFLGLTKPYFTDASGQGHTLTPNGSITHEPVSPYDYVVYSASTHGGSVYLDGTGDSLGIADDASLELGSGDFTLEGWFYATAAGPADNVIVAKCSPSYAPYWVSFYGGATMQFCSSSTNSGWDIANNVQFGSAKKNNWNHFAVSRSGTSIRLFLNGVLGNTVTSSAALTDHTSPFTVGGQYGGANPFTGYVSDIRLVKGTAVYTAAFTPPTESLTAITNTSVLISGTDAKVYDASQSSGTLTLYGNAASSTTQTKNASSSVYFDGTGDWIHLPASEQLEPLGNDFTFEWWWYPTTLSQRQWFFHSATDYWLGVDFQTTVGRGLGMWASSNGSSWNLLHCDAGGNGISNTNPTLNAWNHIAYTRNGNTFTLWLNGTSIVSVGSITSSIVNRSTESKVIGSWAQSNHQLPVVGYIEDFRITKGLARYTTSFTPPTTELEG